MVPLSWSILLAVVLFVIGAAGVLLRRNILVVLMSLEHGRRMHEPLRAHL